jgi:tRNA(Ile)-lysidine synthase
MVSQSESLSPVTEAIAHEFEKRYGVALQGKILVALSGGVDSVALVLGLKEAGVDVSVAHLDHGTRNGLSADDAAWVESFAQSLGIPFTVKRVDVPALADDSKQSFEEVARTIRYDFLVDMARTEGCDCIATGHHADDQAETVMMRVVRGTSLKGLCGIPGVGDWDGMPIVRPLLDVSRVDIEAYMAAQGVEFREDHSNTDRKYVRNRIRHTLMPFLREHFNPQVDEALRRLSQVSKDEDALLDALSHTAFTACVKGDEIDRVAFDALHRAEQRRVLVRLAHDIGALADFDRVKGALNFITSGATGQRYDWGGGVHLSNGREVAQIVHASQEWNRSVEVSVPGHVEAFGYRWNFTFLRQLPDEPLAQYCSSTRQVVDEDALGDKVVLRHREDGDRIQPFGMSGTRKLKDYLNDTGLPIEQRDALVLVTTGEAIVWVAGYAVAELFAVTETTETYIQIDVESV